MITMSDLAVFFSPIVLAFVVIVIGYYIGRIRICNISLDFAAVLICAIIAGYFISHSALGGDVAYLSSLKSAMKNYSTFGTAMFVSAVGLSAGYSISDRFHAKNALYFLQGSLIVIAGFTIMRCIEMLDHGIPHSALLGILCGSLTSTPGMSAACDLNGIIAEDVTLGYGSAYLFGVVFVVLFVQMLTHREKKLSVRMKEKETKDEETTFEFVIQIGITAILGTVIGNIDIPYLGTSLGTSGGILCSGIFVGFIIRRCFPQAIHSQQTISAFRNTGLGLFMVGAGLPAGLQFDNSFDIKWLLYGIILTVIPILIGCLLCRLFKYARLKIACIIAGGMTSTPAVGVLINKYNTIDLSDYSIAYIGALMTMVIGIRLI